MGVRILKLTAEMMVEMLRGLDDSEYPRQFIVSQNPIPANTLISRTTYRHGLIELELRNRDWPEEQNYQEIRPVLTTQFEGKTA